MDETISATGLRCKNIKCKYAFTERVTGRQVSPCKLPPGSERFKFLRTSPLQPQSNTSDRGRNLVAIIAVVQCLGTELNTTFTAVTTALLTATKYRPCVREAPLTSGPIFTRLQHSDAALRFIQLPILGI